MAVALLDLVDALQLLVVGVLNPQGRSDLLDHVQQTLGDTLSQMNQEQGKRVALWGMERRGTREAAELFVKEGLLDRFLELVWHRSE